MSDDHSISRRSSLKGIATTGALIGALGTGVNAVSAGEKKPKDKKSKGDPKDEKPKDDDPKDAGIVDVRFEECHSVSLYFDEAYVNPGAGGAVGIPLTETDDGDLVLVAQAADGALLLPTVGASNVFLGLPTGEWGDDSVELELADGDDDEYVDLPIATDDGSVVIPVAETGDDYLAISLADGHLTLPVSEWGDGAAVLPLDDEVATFQVAGGDADGRIVAAGLVSADEIPLRTVRIRTHNGAQNRAENVQQPVFADQLVATGEGTYRWTFDVFQFYNRALSDGDRIASVILDDEIYPNPNGCARGLSKGETEAVPADPDAIGLEPACVDAETDMARFAVVNAGEEPVAVPYATSDDESGSVHVEPGSVTYVDVAAPDGETTFGLFTEDGDEIAAADSAVDSPCIPRDSVAFNSRCGDAENDRARFYLQQSTGNDLTFRYYVAETETWGTVTVEDSIASREAFWVDAPGGEATVTLFYERRPIATAVSDPDESC